MVDPQSKIEAYILKVEESYRIRLPQPLVHKVGWIEGNQSISAWLLMSSPGRCRLHSTSEVDSHSEFQSLRERITAELHAPTTSPLEFRDRTSVALALRLLPVEVTPPGAGWRLTVPRPMAVVMEIRPTESEIAAIVFDGHIELWTIGELKTAMAPALIDMI